MGCEEVKEAFGVFKTFYGVVKLIQSVLHSSLLGLHVFVDSSQLQFGQTMLTTLITLNTIIVGCTFFVILASMLFNTEIIIFLLEIIIFVIDLWLIIMLWTDEYSNTYENTFRRIHLSILSLVCILQFALLLSLTIKYCKLCYQNLFARNETRNPTFSNASQNPTFCNLNNRQQFREGYLYNYSCEQRAELGEGRISNLQGNVSLYPSTFNPHARYTNPYGRHLNSANTHGEETDLNNSINLSTSDFEISEVDGVNLSSEDEYNELSETLAIEEALPLRLNKTINNLIPSSDSNSNTYENKKPSKWLNGYKVRWADLDETCSESPTIVLMDEKQETDLNNEPMQEHEFKTLLNPVERIEYTKTNTVSRLQTCVAEISSDKSQNIFQKRSDIVNLSEDSFRIEEHAENEFSQSSKGLDSTSHWNTNSQSSPYENKSKDSRNYSTYDADIQSSFNEYDETLDCSRVRVGDYSFRKITFLKLQESLKPVSSFRLADIIKNIFI